MCLCKTGQGANKPNCSRWCKAQLLYPSHSWSKWDCFQQAAPKKLPNPYRVLPHSALPSQQLAVLWRTARARVALAVTGLSQDDRTALPGSAVTKGQRGRELTGQKHPAFSHPQLLTAPKEDKLNIESASRSLITKTREGRWSKKIWLRDKQHHTAPLLLLTEQQLSVTSLTDPPPVFHIHTPISWLLKGKGRGVTKKKKRCSP